MSDWLPVKKLRLTLSVWCWCPTLPESIYFGSVWTWILFCGWSWVVAFPLWHLVSSAIVESLDSLLMKTRLLQWRDKQWIADSRATSSVTQASGWLLSDFASSCYLLWVCLCKRRGAELMRAHPNGGRCGQNQSTAKVEEWKKRRFWFLCLYAHGVPLLLTPILTKPAFVVGKICEKKNKLLNVWFIAWETLQ